MDVLNGFKKGLGLKVKASSLVETLVATVIIVLMFSIASLTLNNIFGNTIRNNTDKINNHLNFLQYQYLNNKIKVPYDAEFEDWMVTINITIESNDTYLIYEATNVKTNKSINKLRIDVDK